VTGLIPFNKRGDLSTDRLFNMMDDFFNDAWLPRRNLLSDTFKVDVRDNEGDYTIEADLPGVKKEEVNLELNEGKLTIAVVRNEQVEDDKKGYIHKERRYSSMQRSVYLADADSENVNAKLNDGVLTVVIPKKSQIDYKKRIEIQ
jgi:HSP20 family protein